MTSLVAGSLFVNDKKYNSAFLRKKAIAYEAGYPPLVNGVLVVDRTDIEQHAPLHTIEIRFTGKGWAILDRDMFRFSKKEQNFIYSPFPSNREEDFYSDTLFETPAIAYEVFDNWREKVIQAELKKGTPRWSEIWKKYKESSGT